MEVHMDILRKAFLVFLLAFPAFVIAAQPVNINTADKATLMNIKGVGQKRAEAIIAYRRKHGPFKSVQELAEVHGIGSSLIERNRASLTVDRKH
jgi:competence protein ComEA